MAEKVPAEVWLTIFRYAVADEELFELKIQTSMEESTWFKMIYGDWALRDPQENVNLMQRRSYTTKKSIVSTCRAWRQLGAEFLFRCLHFNDPACLRKLSPLLNDDHHLGWWTRRIHITRYYAGQGLNMDDMEHVLVSIIKHCPNLEVFIVNWSISSSFNSIISALYTNCHRTLRMVHLHVPPKALAKVIRMLEALPRLVAVHIEFDGALPESVNLGSVCGIALDLPKLEQLSLRGCFQDFIEQAIDWTMPALKQLSLDFLHYRDDFPDVIQFLAAHGSGLLFLDISCELSLDVATILDLCPSLTTFCFGMDWLLQTSESYPFRVVMTHRPHQNINAIGCHQLQHAFGVGYSGEYASVDPIATSLIRRKNDMNFEALNRTNFPKLQQVRVLNRMLLRDLENADGPHQSCFERWERWWDQCANQNIRLEDCTGTLLGTLPPKDERESTDEADFDEEDEEMEEDSEESEIEDGPNELPTASATRTELRQLLVECRRMNETRRTESIIGRRRVSRGAPRHSAGTLVK